MKQPGLISTQICTGLRQVLREARVDAGLSLNELSKRAGLDRRTISFIENGDRIPTMETITRIVAALGIGPSAMLKRAEEAAGTTDWKKLSVQLAQAVKAKASV